MAKRTIPTNNAEFTDWVNNLITVVKEHTIDLKEPTWPHIPSEAVFELQEKLEAWNAAYEKSIPPHGADVTAERNEARDKLEVVLRPFIQRYLYWDPVTDAQRLRMGLHLHGKTKTPIPAPTDIARIKITLTVKGQLKASWEITELHGDPRSNYGVRLHYGIVTPNPAEQTAKTGKHYYLPKRTDNPDELKEDVFLRGSHLIDFHPLDSSLECIFCARLENQKGEAGPWGEMEITVIP